MKRYLFVSLFLVAACVPPTPPPPPPVSHLENFGVAAQASQVVGAHISVRPWSGAAAIEGTTDANGRVSLTVPTAVTGGATRSVDADGYNHYEDAYTFCLSTCEQPPVFLTPKVKPLPPVPTRDQALNIQLHFNDLSVPGLSQHVNFLSDGDQFFHPWVAQLTSADDRAKVYAQARALGDTHFALSAPCHGTDLYPGEDKEDAYLRPNQFDARGMYRALVEEVIRAGLTPMVFLCERNYETTVKQFPMIVEELRSGDHDLNPYVVYLPGWDGVF